MEKDSSVGASVFSISSKLLVSSSLVSGGTIGTEAKRPRMSIIATRKNTKPLRIVSQVHSFWLVKNGCALISPTPFLPSRADLKEFIRMNLSLGDEGSLTDRWGKHRLDRALQWTKEFLRGRRDFRGDSWSYDTCQPRIRRRRGFHLRRREIHRQSTRVRWLTQ